MTKSADEVCKEMLADDSIPSFAKHFLHGWYLAGKHADKIIIDVLTEDRDNAK